MVKKIIDASFHRNGISGVGFWAILFENSDTGELMVASLFDEPGYCAIFSVHKLMEKNIAFARGNSWRGDRYEAELRPLLEEWQKQNESNRFGPFSLIPMDIIEKTMNEILTDEHPEKTS